MATSIAGAYGAGITPVHVASNGDKYIVFLDQAASSVITTRIYKSASGSTTWSLTNTVSFTAGVSGENFVSSVIDDNDKIHIVVCHNSGLSQSEHFLRYSRFDTSTDTFDVTNLEFYALSGMASFETLAGANHCDIEIRGTSSDTFDQIVIVGPLETANVMGNPYSRVGYWTADIGVTTTGGFTGPTSFDNSAVTADENYMTPFVTRTDGNNVQLTCYHTINFNTSKGGSTNGIVATRSLNSSGTLGTIQTNTWASRAFRNPYYHNDGTNNRLTILSAGAPGVLTTRYNIDTNTWVDGPVDTTSPITDQSSVTFTSTNEAGGQELGESAPYYNSTDSKLYLFGTGGIDTGAATDGDLWITESTDNGETWDAGTVIDDNTIDGVGATFVTYESSTDTYHIVYGDATAGSGPKPLQYEAFNFAVSGSGTLESGDATTSGTAERIITASGTLQSEAIQGVIGSGGFVIDAIENLVQTSQRLEFPDAGKGQYEQLRFAGAGSQSGSTWELAAGRAEADENYLVTQVETISNYGLVVVYDRNDNLLYSVERPNLLYTGWGTNRSHKSGDDLYVGTLREILRYDLTRYATPTPSNPVVIPPLDFVGKIEISGAYTIRQTAYTDDYIFVATSVNPYPVFAFKKGFTGTLSADTATTDHAVLYESNASAYSRALFADSNYLIFGDEASISANTGKVLAFDVSTLTANNGDQITVPVDDALLTFVNPNISTPTAGDYFGHGPISYDANSDILIIGARFEGLSPVNGVLYVYDMANTIANHANTEYSGYDYVIVGDADNGCAAAFVKDGSIFNLDRNGSLPLFISEFYVSNLAAKADSNNYIEASNSDFDISWLGTTTANIAPVKNTNEILLIRKSQADSATIPGKNIASAGQIQIYEAGNTQIQSTIYAPYNYFANNYALSQYEDYFGVGCAISDDYIIVSSSREDDFDTGPLAGFIYFYDRNTGQHVHTIAGDGAAGGMDLIGSHLSVDRTTNSLYANFDGSSSLGKILRFDLSNLSLNGTSYANDAVTTSTDTFFFGSTESGDIIADNNTLYVKNGDDVAIYDTSNTAAFSNIVNANPEGLTGSLVNPKPIAISNTYVVFGDRFFDYDGFTNPGKAYVYLRSELEAANTTVLYEIKPQNIQDNGYFANSAAIYNDSQLFINHQNEEGSPGKTGTIYHYDLNNITANNGIITQTTNILTSPTLSISDDNFGQNLAIYNDYLVAVAERLSNIYLYSINDLSSDTPAFTFSYTDSALLSTQERFSGQLVVDNGTIVSSGNILSNRDYVTVEGTKFVDNSGEAIVFDIEEKPPGALSSQPVVGLTAQGFVNLFVAQPDPAFTSQNATTVGVASVVREATGIFESQDAVLNSTAERIITAPTVTFESQVIQGVIGDGDRASDTNGTAVLTSQNIVGVNATAERIITAADALESQVIQGVSSTAERIITTNPTLESGTSQTVATSERIIPGSGTLVSDNIVFTSTAERIITGSSILSSQDIAGIISTAERIIPTAVTLQSEPIQGVTSIAERIITANPALTAEASQVVNAGFVTRKVNITFEAEPSTITADVRVTLKANPVFESESAVTSGTAERIITSDSTLISQSAQVSGSGDRASDTNGTSSLQSQDATLTSVAERIIVANSSSQSQVIQGLSATAERIITANGITQSQSVTVIGEGDRASDTQAQLISQNATTSGTAERIITASGTLESQITDVSGSGDRAADTNGTSVLESQSSQVVGVAERIITGDSTLESQVIQGVNTTAERIIKASGSLSSQNVNVIGSADRASDTQSELQSQSATASGVAERIITTNPAIESQNATTNSVAERIVTASGSAISDPIQGTSIVAERIVTGNSINISQDIQGVSGTSERIITANGAVQSEPIQGVDGSGDRASDTQSELQSQNATLTSVAERIITANATLESEATNVVSISERIITSNPAIQSGSAETNAFGEKFKGSFNDNMASQEAQVSGVAERIIKANVELLSQTIEGVNGSGDRSSDTNGNVILGSQQVRVLGIGGNPNITIYILESQIDAKETTTVRLRDNVITSQINEKEIIATVDSSQTVNTNTPSKSLTGKITSTKTITAK